MKRSLRLLKSFGWFSMLLLLLSCSNTPSNMRLNQNAPRVIAYWHNWNSLSVPYLPLQEVPSAVNTLIVAFALPPSADSAQMTFKPFLASKTAFKNDIRKLQNRGIQVLISVGGGNHPIELNTSQMTLDFVSSMKSIIDDYGFDGLDINLEKSSKVLDSGDLDFKNPTTPKILNMIEAIRALKAYYGPEFLITVAPETQYFVGGYHKYGETRGGYLPLLHALRDDLDVVHMQFYNSGSQFVYTGKTRRTADPIVIQGSPDFVVGLAEMMILGFPVGPDEKQFFPGLGADKVAIGLPSSTFAASGGFLSNQELEQALRYLMTGEANYQSKLTLRKPDGHPNLRGVMTWSINWDRVSSDTRASFEFVDGAKQIFEDLAP
jgi:chitinase